MIAHEGFKIDLTTANTPTGHADQGSGLERAQDQVQRMGLDIQPWQARMQELMDAGARILAFRGAGSVNGIEPEAAQKAVALVRDHIFERRGKGIPVVLMYDGDGDNRAKPDIGAVFGQLADEFNRDPNVIAITAQTEGWYSPPIENAPIQSATGTPYETYIFGDALEGKHSSLTQSAALVAYQNYEQIFVGPAGQIALRARNKNAFIGT